MKHNYKLEELNLMNETLNAGIIDESGITVFLRDLVNIPEPLKKHIESLVNRVITNYEEEIGRELQLESLDLDLTLESSKSKKALELVVYLGSQETMDGRIIEDFITSKDEYYDVTKELFKKKLNLFIGTQLAELDECFQCIN